MQTLDLFGIKVSSIDRQGILEQVVAWAQENGRRRVTYVNANCFNIAARESAYRDLLGGFDLIYSDGIGVVWTAQLLQKGRLYKVTGREWIEGYCSLASAQGIRTCILAGQPGIAQRARQNLERRWPGLCITGAMDGYFINNDEEQVLSEIARQRPQVLLVGMGVPKQEQWLIRHAQSLDVPVVWAVGALFDYVAGVEKPVPSWMERLGLEWLWRLLVDPRGKWKRYIMGNPRFIARVIQEKVRMRGRQRPNSRV